MLLLMSPASEFFFFSFSLQTISKFGKLDILVSNAAVNPAPGPIMLEVCFVCSFVCLLACLLVSVLVCLFVYSLCPITKLKVARKRSRTSTSPHPLQNKVCITEGNL